MITMRGGSFACIFEVSDDYRDAGNRPEPDPEENAKHNATLIVFDRIP